MAFNFIRHAENFHFRKGVPSGSSASVSKRTGLLLPWKQNIMNETITLTERNWIKENLSDRIEITARTERLRKSSVEHVEFYQKYAAFVLRTLKKPLFQKFLYWMMKKENIEAEAIRKVEVRILPFKKKNGNGLAGNCNTYVGRIQIYPKTRKFCQKLMRELGKGSFVAYVRIRARAALIHELLHLKYEKNETRVRELTKEYSLIFTRNRFKKDANIGSINRILFESENRVTSRTNNQHVVPTAFGIQ